MNINQLLAWTLIALCGCAGGANAQENGKPIQEKAGQASADYAKEPYVFELIETRAHFENDGRSQRQLTIRVRVQSESAVRELGLLTYSFASSFETLDVLYVRVRKPDGAVIETPASDVQELDSAVSRQAPMYSDQREKHIAVKALSAGDVLEASLRWTMHDAIAPGQFWFDDSYFRAGICLKEMIQLDVPRERAVKLSYSDPKPKVEDAGDRRIYTFEHSNLKKAEEAKIPEWEKDFYGLEPPEVRLTSFGSWGELGKWFATLQEGKSVVTPEIHAKAEEVTKGLDGEDAKIRALYDFVSLRFRYIGVDLGIGRYAAHPAGDILSNRYGDCKDKHTLLAALLKAEGITAYPALVSSRYRLDADFASPDVLDHVITAIPKGDSFVFLDTTPEVAPYGFLLPGLRNRLTVVVEPGVPKVARTPADPPFHAYEVVRIDSSIDEEGTLDAKMRMEERGDGEFALRAAYRNTPQNRWDELTQNLVRGMGFAGTTSDVSVAAPEDTTKPFVISFSYHRPEFPDWKNHQISLPTPFFTLPELTDEQKASKKPLPLGTATEVTFETSVRLPKGYTALVPGNITKKLDFAEFTADYTMDSDRTMRGTLHLRMLKREIPGELRAQYTELAKSVDEVMRKYIPVTGQFAARPPAELMRALIKGPEGAIPELEKRMAADPDNQAAVIMLSSAYTHTGRAKEAVQLLERALAKNQDYLPMHLALGEAYLGNGETNKAMEQFRMGLEKDPQPLVLNNVAYLLAEARINLNEAERYSRDSVTAIERNTLDIEAEDADGEDFQMMPGLAATWDTLGWIKFQEGDLKTAEIFVKAAWELDQRQPIGEHLAEIYEKEGRPEAAWLVAFKASAAYGDATTSEKLRQMTDRLWKNTPKKPMDGAVELSNMRMVPVAFHPRLQGKSESADVVIVLDAKRKEAEVSFKSGSEEMRKASAALAMSQYRQSFPEGESARIVRKGILSCSVYTKECQVILMPVGDAAVGGE